MKLLLVNPPLSSFGASPYPATAYLKGFLHEKAPASWNLEVEQVDASLDFLCAIFELSRLQVSLPAKYAPALRLLPVVLDFLKTQNTTATKKINSRHFLSLAQKLDPKLWRYADQALKKRLSVEDKARLRASSYAHALVRALQVHVDPGISQNGYIPVSSTTAFEFTFAELWKRLHRKKTNLLEQIIDEQAARLLRQRKPDLIGLSVPFSGSLYGAFRIARVAKKVLPEAKIILGGAYTSHVLRELTERRVMKYFDFVTLGDGERPLLSLLENEHNRSSRVPSRSRWCRTFVMQNGKLKYLNDKGLKDFAHAETGTPSYEGLSLDNYYALYQQIDPVSKVLKQDTRIRLTLAHGCYWHRCAFCDIDMDYVKRFDPLRPSVFVDRMERLIQETGRHCFHFVDEAAPPALLKKVSEEILRRKLKVNWHCNIRFDKAFSKEHAELMAKAGCVMVSGGLESADDQTLKRMNKGIQLASAIRVMGHFSRAGVLVNAYLIYGFPGQDEQATVNGMEVVRQLFEHRCLHSAKWHRFVLTRTSDVYARAEKYGVLCRREKLQNFLRIAVPFAEIESASALALGQGLEVSAEGYTRGQGITKPVSAWFGFSVPKPSVSPSFVYDCLHSKAANA